MHCPICGTLNTADADICIQCGTKLQEIVDEYASGLTHYAGFWWRGLALLFDSFICFTLGATVSFLLIFSGVESAMSRTTLVAEFLFVSLLYYTFFESSHYQGSVGKILMGLRVRTNAGQRLSKVQALNRNLAKFISWGTFGIGFILAAVTEKKKTLHDSIANTVVVRT